MYQIFGRKMTEHDTNSYKWNECIRMIKENLR